jgi:hypothetical protein
LEVYDGLIVFIDYKDLITNNKFNPEINTLHLWNLEKIANAKIFKNNVYSNILTPEEKKRFISVVTNINNKISMKQYENIITLGTQTALYFYLSEGTTSTRFEKLAKVYLSFTELYLASTNLKSFEQLRNKRTKVDVIKLYLVPAFETLFVSLIWKQNIKNVFFKNQQEFTKKYWKSIQDGLQDQTMYFNCSNEVIGKTIKACKQKNKLSK